MSPDIYQEMSNGEVHTGLASIIIIAYQLFCIGMYMWIYAIF